MKKMKLAVLLLAVVLALGCAACGGTQTPTETPAPTPEASAAPVPAPTPTPTAAPASAKSFSADGDVIFAKDGLAVTTAGLDSSPFSEDVSPIIWLEIENTGSSDAYLGVADGSANGFMVQAVRMIFTL